MASGAIQSAPPLARLDHLVLTVASIDETVRFYTNVLGMTEVVFGNGRRALSFGQQKLNLHEAGHEFEPKAARPTPGSADICLIADADPATIAAWLHERGVSVEEGGSWRRHYVECLLGQRRTLLQAYESVSDGRELFELSGNNAN